MRAMTEDVRLFLLLQVLDLGLKARACCFSRLCSELPYASHETTQEDQNYNPEELFGEAQTRIKYSHHTKNGSVNRQLCGKINLLI